MNLFHELLNTLFGACCYRILPKPNDSKEQRSSLLHSFNEASLFEEEDYYDENKNPYVTYQMEKEASIREPLPFRKDVVREYFRKNNTNQKNSEQSIKYTIGDHYEICTDKEKKKEKTEESQQKKKEEERPEEAMENQSRNQHEKEKIYKRYSTVTSAMESNSESNPNVNSNGNSNSNSDNNSNPYSNLYSISTIASNSSINGVEQEKDKEVIEDSKCISNDLLKEWAEGEESENESDEEMNKSSSEIALWLQGLESNESAEYMAYATKFQRQGFYTIDDLSEIKSTYIDNFLDILKIEPITHRQRIKQAILICIGKE